MYQSFSTADSPSLQGCQLPVPMSEILRLASNLSCIFPVAVQCANRWAIGIALYGILLIVFLALPLMSLYIFYDFSSDATFPRHFPSILLFACFSFEYRGEGDTLILPFTPSTTFQKRHFPHLLFQPWVCVKELWRWKIFEHFPFKFWWSFSQLCVLFRSSSSKQTFKIKLQIFSLNFTHFFYKEMKIKCSTWRHLKEQIMLSYIVLERKCIFFNCSSSLMCTADKE